MFELLYHHKPLAMQVENRLGVKPVGAFLAHRGGFGEVENNLPSFIQTWDLIDLLTVDKNGICPAMHVQSKEAVDALKARLPPWPAVKDAICFAKTDGELR